MALTVIRQKILAECAWGVKTTAAIHYTQDLAERQQSLARWKSHTTPLSTDCSGSLTDIYHASDAPDPSGLSYAYIGNTASLYGNAEHVPLADLVGGDFIICFKGTETEHVYIVIERLAGGDLKMFTHGDESCPKYENLSGVKSYWDSIGHLTGCRTLPMTDTPDYKWAILNANAIIGKTRHPAIWATRHPKLFRKYQWIRFRRDVA